MKDDQGTTVGIGDVEVLTDAGLVRTALIGGVGLARTVLTGGAEMMVVRRPTMPHTSISMMNLMDPSRPRLLIASIGSGSNRDE